jgi:hypothetical protein
LGDRYADEDGGIGKHIQSKRNRLCLHWPSYHAGGAIGFGCTIDINIIDIGGGFGRADGLRATGKIAP